MKFQSFFSVVSFFFLCVVLFIPSKPLLWVGFADPYDYLHQANIPLSEMEFFSPTYSETATVYQRAFTVPLFYKLVDAQDDVIVVLQKLLYAVSIIVFVWVISLFLVKEAQKILFLLITFLWALSWNVLGWVNILLSESISTSLFIIWFSSFLYLEKKGNAYTYFGHVLSLFLLVFVKDSWAICLVGFYFLYTLFTYFLDKKNLKRAYLIFSISVLFLFLNTKTATNGARHRTPLTNSIVLRVMPNEEYFNWFIEKGMPQAEHLMAKYGETSSDYKKIYPLYTDSEFSEFRKWIVENGKAVYMQFLVTHPSYFLMLDEPEGSLLRIFSEDYKMYIGDPKKLSLGINPLLTILSKILEYSFLFLLIGVLIITFKKKEFMFISVVCAMFLAVVYVFIAYNGDFVELERHIFPAHIVVQLSSLLSIFCVSQKISLFLNTKEATKTSYVF